MSKRIDAEVRPIDPVMGNTARVVASIVAPEFGVSVDSIYSGERWEPLATARQVSMFLLRTECGFGSSITARAYGCTDHATALHAVNAVRGKKRDIITDTRLDRLRERARALGLIRERGRV